MFPNAKCSSGLTLLEVMIVIAIIGILSAIAAPTMLKYRTKAKNVLAIAEIKLLEQEIEVYLIENRAYPERLDQVKMGFWLDPWGNPYQYLKIASDDDEGEETKGKGKSKDKGPDKGKPRKDHFMVPVNSDYDLYSMGADGDSRAPFTAKASRDDIVRANDGQFIGLASEF